METIRITAGLAGVCIVTLLLLLVQLRLDSAAFLVG